MPIARVPLAALRVRDGKVGLTLDIVDLDPISLIVDACHVEAIVEEIEQELRTMGWSRHDERAHVFVRRSLDNSMRGGDEADKRSTLLAALWLALKHPHHSDEMRRGMSDALRPNGRTHLTVSVDSRRLWAFGLSEQFIDASDLSAILPTGLPFSISIAREESNIVLN